MVASGKTRRYWWLLIIISMFVSAFASAQSAPPLLEALPPADSAPNTDGSPSNAPLALLESGSRPYVQLNLDPSLGEFANIYRAEHPNGPWVKIIDHFPTSAHTAVDYLDRVDAQNVWYRIAPVGDNDIEGEPSAATVVGLPLVMAERNGQMVANAASGFDKNNIITDAQLLNTSTMTRADIQNFLSTRGSVLANLTFNGSTAAQIIYSACQTHGINPQVVLTTLQKEQSLITSSTSNLQTRLNFAMGWGTSSNFSDQVYYGTRQFRRYRDNLSGYVDVRGVPWRVGQLQAVYDGTVTPANITTAGLFIYTPWIGQGGGGRAGVGGNYLFYDIWFNKFGFGGSSGGGATTPPAAPTGLTASALSSSSIRFSWLDNSSNESNFLVSRWNGSTWSQIASVGANNTSYADSGLQPSLTYYYTVCAQNGAGTNCATTYASAATQAGSTVTVPVAPSGLSATALSSSSIRFSWIDNSTNEANFLVSRWNGSAWSQIASVGANNTSYTDSGLQPSLTYYYTVCAQNSAGTNCATTYSSATTQASNTVSMPAAPSGLSATTLSSSSIRFSWLDNSNNETNFLVSRWNGSTWSQIASVGANNTSYTDSGLQPSLTYYYTVCAQNSAGTNCATTYASSTTQSGSTVTVPMAPSGLGATALSSSSIRFSWLDNSNNETNFLVSRWNGSAWSQIASVGANATSFTDSGLQPSATYYYTVCAQNSAGANCATTYTYATTQSGSSATMPTAPSGLSAYALSMTSIRFSWIDNSNNESNFVIARWNGSAWMQIASVGANTTGFTDSGLSSRTTYYYTVCAQNSVGANCASTYASATTP